LVFESLKSRLNHYGPRTKLKAFLIALPLCTIIAKALYSSLPTEMQKELRKQILIANRESSKTSDGTDHGLFYGSHILATQINSPLIQTAVKNYLARYDFEPANL